MDEIEFILMLDMETRVELVFYLCTWQHEHIYLVSAHRSRDVFLPGGAFGE